MGIVAGLYHGAPHRLRSGLRKLDYYTIAVSSCKLRAAAGLAGPRLLDPLLLAAMPLKPTLVSGINFVAVEVGGVAGAWRCVLVVLCAVVLCVVCCAGHTWCWSLEPRELCGCANECKLRMRYRQG